MKHIALALCLLASPSFAQESVFDRVEGLWGSIDNPETSCERNPHRISFTAQPSHAILQWAQPIRTYADTMQDRAVYDIADTAGFSITMRLEGELRLTDGGVPVVWILRLATDGQTYCWGRTDWSILQCAAYQRRCGQDVPSS